MIYVEGVLSLFVPLENLVVKIVFFLVINSFVTKLKHTFSNIYAGYKKK